VQRSTLALRRLPGQAAAATLAALFALAAVGAQASTLARADLDQMLAACALVFEGEVVEVRAAREADGIHTWVRFAVLDTIKGAAGDTLSLRFQGGIVAGEGSEVVGSPIPKLGERGIYFVEATDRFLVNPLYGWHQGRLLVTRDRAGAARVQSSAGAPVVSIGAAPAAGVQGIAAPDETASGIGVAPGAPLESALRVEQVKAALAARLAGRR
jgi:hypothetical protein